MNTDIVSTQEAAVLRAVAQVGSVRALQLVTFYQSIFEQTDTKVNVSERVKDKAAKQLLAAFPALGVKRKMGAPPNPNSVMGRIRTSMFAAIDAGKDTKKDIYESICKDNPELALRTIDQNLYQVKGVLRKDGKWSRA